MAVFPVTSRNARFQQWTALLGNRQKRQRAGEFLVHGVRPITLAVQHGWEIRTWLCNAGADLSRWAVELLDRTPAPRYSLTPELIGELGERAAAAPPELVAVVGMPADDLGRLPLRPDLLAVVLDRPNSPGNIGTLVRSADAFGGSGLLVTGHAADIYDPKAVRASTGSLFALPTVRVPTPGEVLDWVAAARARGIDVNVVGTDERGDVELHDVDLRRPTLVLIGNETSGLSTAWRDACDQMAQIPIIGAASSLNAASAGSVVLYEAARQRRAAGTPAQPATGTD